MIESVLKEYRRVISEHGTIFLLHNKRNPRFPRGRRPGQSEEEFNRDELERKRDLFYDFRPHSEIARSLGFNVGFVNEPSSIGIALRPPSPR